MSADFELARGRVLHFNEDAWDALQNALAKAHLTVMAEHVAEQRKKDVVVLDLEDPKRLYADLCAAIEACGHGHVAARLVTLAGEIHELIKPPRIREPGLWGVVQASRREVNGRTDVASGHWVRTSEDCYPWQHASGSWTAEWEHLIDPTLVRDGIEATS